MLLADHPLEQLIVVHGRRSIDPIESTVILFQGTVNNERSIYATMNSQRDSEIAAGT